MIHDVISVSVVGDHRLHLRFSDGAEGEVDVAELVPFEGVFAQLRDPQKFARVRVDAELGTVVWPGGADLDPVVLYRFATRSKGSH